MFDGDAVRPDQRQLLVGPVGPEHPLRLEQHADSIRTDSLHANQTSHWQNAWIESFNVRLRDELINVWHLHSLHEARIHIVDSRIDYNCNRPHNSRGDITSTDFATQWTTT